VRVGVVQPVLRGCQGLYRVFWMFYVSVSATAQVELKSERVYAPASHGLSPPHLCPYSPLYRSQGGGCEHHVSPHASHSTSSAACIHSLQQGLIPSLVHRRLSSTAEAEPLLVTETPQYIFTGGETRFRVYKEAPGFRPGPRTLRIPQTVIRSSRKSTSGSPCLAKRPVAGVAGGNIFAALLQLERLQVVVGAILADLALHRRHLVAPVGHGVVRRGEKLARMLLRGGAKESEAPAGEGRLRALLRLNLRNPSISLNPTETLSPN
jgi:hypothetical protein